MTLDTLAGRILPRVRPMLSTSLITLLLLLSVSIWGMIATRWSRGQPALEALPRNPSPWLPVACTAAAVYIGLMLAASLIASFSDPQQAPTITLSHVRWSVLDGVGEIIIAVALLTALAHIPFRDVGIDRRQLGRQVREGVCGFAASLAPVLLIILLTAQLRTPENQHPFLKLLHQDRTAGTLAWLLLSAVVIAPIKEELLFRVMLQDGLARRIGAAPAIGIASLLFCAVHGFPDSIALLPLAVILGYVYDRRQSVLSIVLIHALFNLTNIGLLLMGEPE